MDRNGEPVSAELVAVITAVQHGAPLVLTTADGGRLPGPRPQQPLAFESIERGVHGVNRHVPARFHVDFLPDGRAVRLLAQPEHAKQDELFEIAEDRAFALKPHCGSYLEGLDGARRRSVRYRGCRFFVVGWDPFESLP